MNQTRAFLLFAWLMVASLLWMEWNKEHDAARAPALPAGSAVPSAAVPGAAPAVPGVAALPVAGAAAASQAAAAPVSVLTDVLRVELDGTTLRQADLLKYPQIGSDTVPVRLLASDAANYFVASSQWQPAAGAAAVSFVPAAGTRSVSLAPGASRLDVPFVWNGPNGVSIRRTYTFHRGQYVVDVRDEVLNAGAAPWQGYVQRALTRVPREAARKGPTSAESYSFQGAAWYSPAEKYRKRKYADFVDDGPLDQQVSGGWIGMLQHHFFAAWIPQKDQAALYHLGTDAGRYAIEARGPAFTVAPGARASTQARLWVGPKLVSAIQAQHVPGLERAVDYSSYSTMATIAGWLFWVLDKIHALVGNWGWAIVGLVLVIKLLMFPISAAQYRSSAKMRKFQPRIQALKERHGEDKQKFQMEMLELYKREKINPVGGCLPLLIQMPVFLALYWMLSESVELRHAPWVGWIHDLTARDPYFVLPVINMALMWATQKMTPQMATDPIQQKMLQLMPLVFGVMFAFFPAGLVLYWITNSGLGLLQQWWMMKRYADAPAAPVKPKR